MIAKAFGYLCHADPAGPAAGHKSSMLQDLERGRHAEIDALLLAPQALARSAGVRVPVLDTIISLVGHKFS
jgi:2-dehydropantoate 2-reductase